MHCQEYTHVTSKKDTAIGAVICPTEVACSEVISSLLLPGDALRRDLLAPLTKTLRLLKASYASSTKFDGDLGEVALIPAIRSRVKLRVPHALKCPDIALEPATSRVPPGQRRGPSSGPASPRTTSRSCVCYGGRAPIAGNAPWGPGTL